MLAAIIKVFVYTYFSQLHPCVDEEAEIRHLLSSSVHLQIETASGSSSQMVLF